VRAGAYYALMRRVRPSEAKGESWTEEQLVEELSQLLPHVERTASVRGDRWFLFCVLSAVHGGAIRRNSGGGVHGRAFRAVRRPARAQSSMQQLPRGYLQLRRSAVADG
jgi:hypothetical protein